MSHSGTVLGLPHLQPRLLEGVLRTEVARFIKHAQRPETEAQRLRGLLIASMAVFVPESFSRSLIASLVRLRRRCTQLSDYSTAHWYRLLEIDTALFALHGDLEDLRNLRRNYDHHNLGLRYRILRTLSLVAHRIPFPDAELVSRAGVNLACRHGHSEESACLALLGTGSRAVKHIVLRSWIEVTAAHQPASQVLRQFHESGSTDALGCLRTDLASIMSYVLLRLCSWRSARSLPPEDPQWLPGIWAIPADVIWRRVQSHPLMPQRMYLQDEGIHSPLDAPDSSRH